jgi:Ca2+-dependent lipid-binding protein
MVGKMDPYLELTIGGVQIYKTKVLDGAGKEPVWNEEVTFEVKDLS